MNGRILVARLDNLGDVLLTGPTVRAVAAKADQVTYLAGPTGRAAAELLPGIDEVITFAAPWILDPAVPVTSAAVADLVATVSSRRFDAALILTSFHQSPLPLALLLRLAGIDRIAATSVDYPGTLLDERLPYEPGLHEVEQNLLVAQALGFTLSANDDGLLAVKPTPPSTETASALPARYVVVHPHASVTARSMPDALVPSTVDALHRSGRNVVLTGADGDDHRDRLGDGVVDLRGRTDLGQLAAVLRHADAVVTANTGPAHLAAAVGTPVVSIFAPVVDPARWHPWRVPNRLLGQLDIECAGCRSRICPFPGQPCTASIRPIDVVAAVEALTPLPLERSPRS